MQNWQPISCQLECLDARAVLGLLSFPSTSKQGPKDIRVCVWGCGGACTHAWTTHTCAYTCVCLCNHHVSTCGDQRLTSQCLLQSLLPLTFQLFYLLFLLSLTIIQCIWCMCVSVGTQVLCGGQRTTSRSLLSFHREFQGSNSAFLEFVAGSLMHRVTPLALLLIFWGRISHWTLPFLAREGDQQALSICLSLLHNIEVMDIHNFSRLLHFHF